MAHLYAVHKHTQQKQRLHANALHYDLGSVFRLQTPPTAFDTLVSKRDTETTRLFTSNYSLSEPQSNSIKSTDHSTRLQCGEHTGERHLLVTPASRLVLFLPMQKKCAWCRCVFRFEVRSERFHCRHALESEATKLFAVHLN